MTDFRICISYLTFCHFCHFNMQQHYNSDPETKIVDWYIARWATKNEKRLSVLFKPLPLLAFLKRLTIDAKKVWDSIWIFFWEHTIFSIYLPKTSFFYRASNFDIVALLFAFVQVCVSGLTPHLPCSSSQFFYIKQAFQNHQPSLVRHLCENWQIGDTPGEGSFL